MTCTHSAACPLFQLVDASFEGWRHYYCDSEARWRDCARYQQAVRGQHVALSLLPNGHDALHLAQRARSGAPSTAPASATPGTPTLSELMFERPGAPDPGQRYPGQGIPRPRPLPSGQQAALPAAAPAHLAEQRKLTKPPKPSEPREHWWNRLAEWMRRPM
jgi:hypothetical protein